MEKKIYSAIKACTKIGLDLSDYDFGFSHHNNKWVSRSPWVHPLVALVLVDQPKIRFEVSEEEIIRQHLWDKYKKSGDWFESFCLGITRTIGLIKDKNSYNLGTKIRKEYQLWKVR